VKRAHVAVAAGLALALIVGLGLRLSGARASRTEAYARERAAQRRAASATRPPAPARSPATTTGGWGISSDSDRPLACVTGVETFAVAVERALFPLPPSGPRRIAMLRQISEAAARFERHAELARPAPTLPKRMGLEGGAPVDPERPACDGRGYAELR
jgi:hypothetical protein